MLVIPGTSLAIAVALSALIVEHLWVHAELGPLELKLKFEFEPDRASKELSFGADGRVRIPPKNQSDPPVAQTGRWVSRLASVAIVALILVLIGHFLLAPQFFAELPSHFDLVKCPRCQIRGWFTREGMLRE